MSADRKARWLNLTGLFLELVGVFILFRYGMPFHVPTHGTITLIIERRDLQAVALERRYELLGYVGLGLLVGGTLLQMWAVALSGKNGHK
jgi:hypothetical protein